MTEWIQVATRDEVPDGEVRVVVAGGKRLVVCRIGDEFYALDDLCTHDNGPLGEGLVEDHEIECPRHGARFDVRTGRAVVMPAVVPIGVYPVRVEGDEISVALESSSR
jgi:3-phenylpropionate/trans-cinnamate dioxygenase ferredoxin component